MGRGGPLGRDAGSERGASRSGTGGWAVRSRAVARDIAARTRAPRAGAPRDDRHRWSPVVRGDRRRRAVRRAVPRDRCRPSVGRSRGARPRFDAGLRGRVLRGTPRRRRGGADPAGPSRRADRRADRVDRLPDRLRGRSGRRRLHPDRRPRDPPS